MSYVMVPVPVQFVNNVMKYVIRIQQRGSLSNWTSAAMKAFLSEPLEEKEWSLLVKVADSADRGESYPLQRLASDLEMDMSGLLKTCQALGRKSSEAGRVAPFESELRDAPAALGSEPSGQIRVMVMDHDVASMIQEARGLRSSSHQA